VAGLFLRGPRLYLADEPESGLSVPGQLQLLLRVMEAAAQRGQFIVSTHSPILSAVPEAQILRLGQAGVEPVPHRQTDAYRLTRDLLDHPGVVLRHLTERAREEAAGPARGGRILPPRPRRSRR